MTKQPVAARLSVAPVRRTARDRQSRFRAAAAGPVRCVERTAGAGQLPVDAQAIGSSGRVAE